MKYNYCENWGQKSISVALLTSGSGKNHPMGALKGKHQPAL